MNGMTFFSRALAGASMALGLSLSAQAAVVQAGRTFTPLVLSGALPDTPAARVDPNLPTSRFSGVVSINIRYNLQLFICSGALIGARHVLSAGH